METEAIRNNCEGARGGGRKWGEERKSAAVKDNFYVPMRRGYAKKPHRILFSRAKDQERISFKSSSGVRMGWML